MWGKKKPNTYHDELDERVEHVLTTLALANTMAASAGEPQKGGSVGRAEKRGAMGRAGGQAAWTHTWDAACVSLEPRAALSSPAECFPSTETRPAVLNELSREGAHPIPAGAVGRAPMPGMEEPFGTTPVELSVLGSGSVQPVRSRRGGRVPVCVPAIRGENEDGEGHCSKRP